VRKLVIPMIAGAVCGGIVAWATIQLLDSRWVGAGDIEPSRMIAAVVAALYILIAVGSMIGTSVMLAVFAVSTGEIMTIRMAAFTLGIFMFGGIVGLYAFLARAFPARLRVTGCGLAIACGRGGSIAGPVLGGVLLDLGVSAETALITVGVAAAIGAMFLSPIKLLPEE